MKRYVLVLCFFSTFLLLSSNVSAKTGWWDILRALGQMYGVNLDIKGIAQGEYDRLNELLGGMTGTHTYGELFDQDTIQWGGGTDNLADILTLYQGGSGTLAHVSQKLEKEFPILDNLGSSSDVENAYYLLEAKTALASRASSEVSFHQISAEANVIEKLQLEIDKTKDSKSAADLNNRLIVEQSKLQLQTARLLALLLQQNAVAAQEKVNISRENAAFFKE